LIESSSIPPAGPAATRLKEALKHRLLRAAGVRRIHIVGCARSGTTMLHYAMTAFADTMILDDVESPVWSSPTLGNCVSLLARFGWSSRARYVVTKRSPRWYLPDETARIAHSTRAYGTFLVNIVRDPRDVVTSHKRGREGFYVDLQRWQRSIEASEALLEALRGQPRVLTVRYEDVVGAPEGTAALLQHHIGLRMRPGVRSFADLDKNVARSGQSTERASAMHGVRSLNGASVGRWRSDPIQREFIGRVLDDSDQSTLMRRFMRAHGYALEDGAAV
jgi:hypothetical protein